MVGINQFFLYLMLVGMIILSAYSTSALKQSALSQKNNALMTNATSSIQDFNTNTNLPVTNSTASSFLTYENHTLGIKIQYPAEWNKTNVNNSVIFSSPLEGSSDKFTEYLSIEFDVPLPPQYNNISSAELVSEVIPLLRESLLDFELHESKPITLKDGSIASTILYTASNPQYGILKELDIEVIKEGKLYEIVYAAKPQKYSIFLPTVQQMMNSFEFVPVLGNKFTPEDILDGRTSTDIILPFLIKLQPADLVKTLNSLSTAGLVKTLNSLSTADLTTVLNHLPQDNYREILNKLPPNERAAILERLTPGH
jgi:MgtE intracellular N domain/PsbP